MHIPVMINEVLGFLDPQRGEVIVDGTLGAGGHAAAIAEKIAPDGTLIGLDWDESMLTIAQERLAPYSIRKCFVNTDYRNIRDALNHCGVDGVDGILLDLGICSLQIDDPERGLAFRYDAPLDMRLDRHKSETAADLLNRRSERDIAHILWEYGEERWSKAIARAIVQRRMAGRMQTTGDLVGAVLEAIPRRFQDKRIHPATKTFQALRIAVNQELEDLEGAIETAFECLKPGGRLVILAYHSLEDRVIKQLFRRLSVEVELPLAMGASRVEHAPAAAQLLTKKPLEPTEEEVQQNPRARSAKLRAVKRL